MNEGVVAVLVATGAGALLSAVKWMLNKTGLRLDALEVAQAKFVTREELQNCTDKLQNTLERMSTDQATAGRDVLRTVADMRTENSAENRHLRGDLGRMSDRIDRIFKPPGA